MKKIGIGYENYKEFTDENLYYIDKTMLIRDVIRKGGKVTLTADPESGYTFSSWEVSSGWAWAEKKN